jgi:hypothetical protein
MTLSKAILLSALLCAGSAFGHDSPMGMQYDPWCCRGNDVGGDCAPIPPSSLRATKGGYEVSVGPGDHPLLTKPHVFFMPYDKVRESTDGQPHACFFPNEDTLRCLYVPNRGA